jgi:phage baseplate assembly protein V
MVNKLIAPLTRRVRLMVGRGVLALVNDSFKMQGIQVELLAGEVRNMERFQDYGFTSVPHPGAEVAAVFVDGNRGHGIAIRIDDRRYRLNELQVGEVALYTDEGDKIVLKRGGIVEITASAKVRVVAPLLECTGDIKSFQP